MPSEHPRFAWSGCIEMKVYDNDKDEPRIIQRARFLETCLREDRLHGDDELIVGSINSKVRGSTISGAISLVGRA